MPWKSGKDEDFNRATPLFWCPLCYLHPAWLDELSRDRHLVRDHPRFKGVVYGSGLNEWEALHGNSIDTASAPVP